MISTNIKRSGERNPWLPNNPESPFKPTITQIDGYFKSDQNATQPPNLSYNFVCMTTNPQNSGFSGNVLKLVSGTTGAQLITLLTAPIISRLFLPEAFGTLSVFISIVSILSIIVCLRYEFAIMLPEDDGEAINVMALSLVIALFFSLAVGVLLLLARQWLVPLLNIPDLAPYLWLIPIALLIQGLFQSFNYWNSRKQHFGQLSIARIAASLTTSAIPITLGLTGKANTAGLIASWVAGTAVLTTVLGLKVWKQSIVRLSHELRISQIRTSLARYRKFPLVDAWGGFINNFSWQMPSLVLSVFFTQTIVGYYSQANRIVLLPMILIGNAISQVFFQRTAELRGNPEKLTATVQSIFRALVFLGLIPALVLTLVGRELFTIVLGANWSEAGIYAQILGPWIFFLFISSPLSTLFMVLERQELSLIVNVAILITRLAALFTGCLLHNILLTLVIWSGSGILVYGLMSGWIMKLAGIRYTSLLPVIGHFALSALPVGLAILITKLAFPGQYWLTLWVTAIAVFLYYFLILHFDQSLSRSLLNILPAAWHGRIPDWIISKP